METRLLNGAIELDDGADLARRARQVPNKPGELQIQVTPVDGQVQLDFGTPVEWLRLTPAMARKLADDLLSAANRAARIVLAGG